MASPVATATDSDRYIEARKGARQIRRKAYWTHRYQCDFTAKTCMLKAYRWGSGGLAEAREFGQPGFEVTDGHW